MQSHPDLDMYVLLFLVTTTMKEYERNFLKCILKLANFSERIVRRRHIECRQRRKRIALKIIVKRISS